VERDLKVLEVRRWRELVIEKNGEVLFDRPMRTAGCSANGRIRSLFSFVRNCLVGWSVHLHRPTQTQKQTAPRKTSVKFSLL
jgi:hypothetical protein